MSRLHHEQPQEWFTTGRGFAPRRLIDWLDAESRRCARRRALPEWTHRAAVALESLRLADKARAVPPRGSPADRTHVAAAAHWRERAE